MKDPPSRKGAKRGASKELASAAKRTKNVSRSLRTSAQPGFKNAVPSTKLKVYVFGAGSAGELGLGNGKNVQDVELPRLNEKLTTAGVVDVATGGMHAVALTHDNKVLTWGVNDSNTLARDTTWEGGMKDIEEADDSGSDESECELNPLESHPAPITADKFPPNIKIVQVAAGDSTTFILTEEGLVYGWGVFRDGNGKFGFSLDANDAVIGEQREPMLIPALENITSLSANCDFCLALDSKGTVFAWGAGDQAELGRRLTPRRRNTALRPSPVPLSRKKMVSIHAGTNHAFAIDSNGDTWAWGSSNFAQTGIPHGAGEGGSMIIKPQRVRTLAGKNMKMVNGGLHHSIGVTHSGECLVWGRMDGAQMGLDISQFSPDDVIFERGKPRILLQPTPLPISGCVHVAAGPDHNIVVTGEGKAYSWGFNATYQCGQRTSGDIPVATLIDNGAIRGEKLCWAGAGGQYSFLASPC